MRNAFHARNVSHPRLVAAAVYVKCCRMLVDIALLQGAVPPDAQAFPRRRPRRCCAQSEMQAILSRKRTFPGKAPEPKPRVLLPPLITGQALLTARLGR